MLHSGQGALLGDSFQILSMKAQQNDFQDCFGRNWKIYNPRVCFFLPPRPKVMPRGASETLKDDLNPGWAAERPFKPHTHTKAHRSIHTHTHNPIHTRLLWGSRTRTPLIARGRKAALHGTCDSCAGLFNDCRSPLGALFTPVHF